MAWRRAKEKGDLKVYGNVFSEFSLRNIHKLASQGYFEELVHSILLGKEANIFLAKKADGSFVVVKIYRLENCNFNKMYDYLTQDMRYGKLRKSKRDVVFAWTQREYRNLMLARNVIDVPTPYAVKDNIIVMEFIGKDNPAPKLKDYDMKNPKKMFDEIVKSMEKLALSGLVHGDLSEFNILIQDDAPIFIDFSQATSFESGNAPELLRRDARNVCNFFRKAGVKADAEKTAEDILRKMKEKREKN